jgi:outer membrane receptor protein involved in Fe transport
MANLGGERSRRFLDPVSLENFHNQGSSRGAEAELIWAPGRDSLTLRAGRAGSSFEVPHDEAQEQAGQDQRQSHEQRFATLNWQRSWSGSSVSQVALFARRTNGRLRGEPSDMPLFAEADRAQDRLGLLAALTAVRGRHRVKAGLEVSQVRLDERFQFFVTDPERGEPANLSEEVLQHDREDPFRFAGGVRRPIHSSYVQDSWRPGGRLTLELGVRYDRSRLLLSEAQWSPRLGASYRVGRTVLRASLNRFFQPPQTEYLLLASSSEARRLSPFAEERGSGGGDVRAERQTAVELGSELWLAGALRVDVAAWQRWIRNQGDPNVFFGTTIIFPNSVARGRAKGLDLRVELPRRRGISGFVTYTLAQVEQFGPIDGGLFLEDDFLEIGPGTRFTPDHDQRHALSAELSYEEPRRGLWLALSGRYRSGTPLEVADEELAELGERPGADLVDLGRGRVKPYAVFDLLAGARLVRRQRFELQARGSLLNLTGARYAFNFGNPFSGTHFGAPRSGRVELRLALR